MKKKRIKAKNAQTNAAAVNVKKVSTEPTYSKKLKWGLAVLITVFAFILYSQSIKHNYTLDDHKVVDKNTVTTSGLEGIPTILKTDYWYGSGQDNLRGPIYRPMSLIVFATLWQLSPDNPQLYHFVNVILFAVTCLVLFILLCELFKNQNLLIPFVCSLLYAAHPIHTEVVNNIKSLDEILCFLFALLSIWYLFRHKSTESKLPFILGGICFFLSLLSKETGIAFLILIPLTLFFFKDDSKKSIVPAAILFTSITIFWLLIRAAVFKDLPRNLVTETSALNNTLYAAPDFISRYATAFFILLRYVGLLFFPHPLTADYNYAQIKIQTFSDPGAFIGLILYVAIGVYAIWNIRRKSIVSYAILFYLITLAPVSNIFFLGGSSMAERFLYMPSFGFCLAISYILSKITKADKSAYNNPSKFFSTRPALFALVFGICILYSVKIYSRNKDWKDTLTIFSRDIQVSQNSATANMLLGNAILLSVARSPTAQHRTDSFNLAKKYLKRALDIAPGFFNASSNLGYIFLTERKPDSAYLYLKEGIKFGPDNVQLNYYYGSALLYLNRFDEAISVGTRLLSISPMNEDAHFMLASAYLKKGDINKGLSYYERLLEINPNNAKAYYLAGKVLRSQGNTAKADEFMNKATTLGYRPFGNRGISE